nr:Ig-like domain-containing protein [Bacteroidota bacterium]
MKFKFSNIIKIISLGIISWITWYCANPVSPTGGPQDIKPPGVVSSEPPNYSVFFDKQRISITFDEFVQLKNPTQQVIISPPLEKNPEFRLRGKSVIIDLDEELKQNTTYSIFFGNSIVDLAESNPLSNYMYVFSTGDHIDSLAIGGEVLNAFDLLPPPEDVFVMLYPPVNDTVPEDSVPYLVRPLYISKIDENGIFQLRNLRQSLYKIFALKDLNNNYLFDLPNEEIAFIDSLITPEAIVFQDIEIEKNDTIPRDSIIVDNVYSEYYHLLMFGEIDSIQRLADAQTFYPPKFRLIFKFPANDPKIKFITRPDSAGLMIEELNPGRDSLMVWLKSMTIDSLEVQIADGDSILDTTLLVFKERQADKKSRRKKDDDKPSRLKINTNLSGRSMELGQKFRLSFDDPLVDFDFADVFFVDGEDTTTGAPFVGTDSIGRKFILDLDLEEETSYEFIFPDSTLFNIYGLTNDSTQLKFKTRKISDYGNLKFDITLESGDFYYIVQLLDTKEKILVEKYVKKSEGISFEFLKPSKYKVKVIQDRWINRRWDTGLYLKKIQPENVYYFPAEIEVRANWDIEESWSLP